MKHTHSSRSHRPITPRASARHAVTLPARLTWKDQRGTMRFASVITRNVSELGVFVECQSAVTIPLFRLVHFQLEPHAVGGDQLPTTLRDGRVLSAVYRIHPQTEGGRQGLALRLMVDPRRIAAAAARPEAETTRATA